MGLLFDNFESKSAVRGRKLGLKQRFEEAYRRGYEEAYRRKYEQGFKQGVEQVYARWRAWIEDNPEVKKLIEEGKVSAPPWLDNDKK